MISNEGFVYLYLTFIQLIAWQNMLQKALKKSFKKKRNMVRK